VAQVISGVMLRDDIRIKITETETNTSNGKGPLAILRIVAIGAAFLLLLGFLIDAFSGFYVFSHSKSVYAGCAGLTLLSVFYLLGEMGSNWINSKDKTTHPLHKRIFHLLLLLIYAALIMLVAGAAFKYIGILKT
jgi:hypothetical protein